MQVTRIVCVLTFASAVLAQAQNPSAPAPNVVTPAGTVTNAPAAGTNTLAPVIVVSPQGTNLPPGALVTETRSIALQEAIELALRHNLDVQIQKFTPEIARYNLALAYGGYDPNLFASGQHNYRQSPGGIDQQGRVFLGNETEGDSFSAGLGGLLPWGLNYSLAGNASDQLVKSPGIQLVQPATIVTNFVMRPDGSFDTNAIVSVRTNYTELAIQTVNETSSADAGFMTLSQPLLRGFLIDPTRANIQIAKNRLKYSELTFRFQVMNTVYAVEQAYYNLIFARENVRVQETALQLAERLLWENRKRVEVGQMAPLDEKQAESQAAASRADLLAAQRALDAQENILKSLITDAYTTWHKVRVIPAENLVAVPPILNLQESWNRALQLRPDLQQARLDVDRNQILVKLDRNQLLPQLNLVGQYGYTGRGREYSGAFGQLRETDNPFWYYGAQLNYPIGNITARNNYKISKAQKEQSQLVLKQREQNVMISVDDAVKLVQTDFARVEATREARLFAQSALEAEQKKLENGKSTSFFVLQFQRDLTAARFAEIQALAEYNIALAQLALTEGYTLDRHHLNIEIK